jgi:hypothetical protein
VGVGGLDGVPVAVAAGVLLGSSLARGSLFLGSGERDSFFPHLNPGMSCQLEPRYVMSTWNPVVWWYVV